jgi:methylmalonyl-CoA epimerase
MSISIHHIAIAVHDLEAALAFYRDALGLEVTERREVPEEGVEIAFLPAGEGEIELLQPLNEASSVAQFLEKRVEVAMERLRAAGARLLSDEPRVNVHGTRYVFVHPRSAHGVLLEVYECTMN